MATAVTGLSVGTVRGTCEPEAKLWSGPSRLIRRTRLLDRIDELGSARITVVQTPAGYGKTTLMLQLGDALRETGSATAWVSVKRADADAGRLLRRILSSLADGSQLPPATGPRTVSPQMADSAQLLERICQLVTERAVPLFLFLDDIHHLRISPAAQALATLLDDAPATLRVVLSSRGRPPIPLGRLRACGDLLELGQRELRFSAAETAHFFMEAGPAQLTPADIAVLERHTEGWVLGLRLASRALHLDASLAQRLPDLNGERSEFADFFAEEVWTAASPALQEFLLKTSVLDRMCVAVCDALTGRNDSRQMLDESERAGLFLLPLDEHRSWYRHHPLFCEFLRREARERNAQQIIEQHRRASNWFAAEDLNVEAFDHAIKAGDGHRAAEIADLNSTLLLSEWQQQRITLRCASEIPPHVKALYPRIMLDAAWLMIVKWRFDQARELLDETRARLNELRASGGMASEQLAGLWMLLRHRDMLMAQFQDDMAKAERLSEELIREHTGAHPYLKASFHMALLYAQQHQYKLGETDRLDGLARKYIERTNSPKALVFHEAAIASARAMAGRCDAAMQSLRNGLSMAITHSGTGSALGAIVALPLAAAHYERNEIEQATRLLEEYLPVATECGYVDQLVAGWVTRSRIQCLHGDPIGALQTLEDAGALALRLGFDRLRVLAGVEQIRQLLHFGRAADAQEIAQLIGIPRDVAGIAPAPGVTTCDEGRAIAWVRLAQSHNRLGDAIRAARQWRAFVATAHANRCMIRWEILLSGLLLLDGQGRAALRSLRQAMATAAPGRFMRIFLDEGALIGSLLLEQRHALQTNSPMEHFAVELTQAFQQEIGTQAARREGETDDADSFQGVLNPREIEILSLVGARLMNREIGEKMGMTEGSVKWYLQQVYNKIGVRRRSQALEKARRFGLIN